MSTQDDSARDPVRLQAEGWVAESSFIGETTEEQAPIDPWYQGYTPFLEGQEMEEMYAPQAEEEDHYSAEPQDEEPGETLYELTDEASELLYPEQLTEELETPLVHAVEPETQEYLGSVDELGEEEADEEVWEALDQTEESMSDVTHFNFYQNTSINEPWHLEHQDPGSREAEGLEWDVQWNYEVGKSLAIVAGRTEVAHVPLLSQHKGSPPDLILRWNDMQATPTVIDVVVHLHGYSSHGAKMNLRRDKEPYSGLDFASPENPNSPSAKRQRPTLGILPRGNYFGGKTGAGYNFPALTTPTGLQELINFSLQQLGQINGVPNLRRGRLILTAHSGGGAALMGILRHKHNNPDEIYVFDALYGPSDNLIRWARDSIRKAQPVLSTAGPVSPQALSELLGALRVLYIPGTGTQSNSLAVQRALSIALSQGGSVLGNRYRVEATNTDHLNIPRRVGWRLLADAGATLPHVSPAPLPGPRPKSDRKNERGSTAFRPTPVESPGGGRIVDKIELSQTESVTVTGLGGKRVQLRRLAAEAWRALVSAARENGLPDPLLLPVSGYRSVEHQKRLWQQALKKYGSPEEARKWVAPPGGSSHQTGRAIDFYLGGKNSSGNVANLRVLPAYQWLVNNAARFGFYPYEREPWHWEYNPPSHTFEQEPEMRVEPQAEEFAAFHDELYEEEADEEVWEALDQTEELLPAHSALEDAIHAGRWGSALEILNGQWIVVMMQMLERLSAPDFGALTDERNFDEGVRTSRVGEGGGQRMQAAILAVKMSRSTAPAVLSEIRRAQRAIATLPIQQQNEVKAYLLRHPRSPAAMAVLTIDLPAILGPWRVAIVEQRGWRTRGAFPFTPEGVIVHHTAGAARGDAPSLPVVLNGRPDLASPLCHLLIARSGAVHVISGRRANHAGKGSSDVLNNVKRDIVPVGDAGALRLPDNTGGNQWFFGIEVENTGRPSDPYPPVQLDALVRCCAALCNNHHWTSNRVIHHREWTHRKADMSFRGPLRDLIQNRLAAGP